jgi:hypothetical protein
MESYNIAPRIFAFLICSRIDREPVTGGLQLFPFNHVAIRSLPSQINVVLFADIMAPPGEYALTFRIFHTQDKEAAVILHPTPVVAQPDKNIEYMIPITITIKTAGLYLAEASLVNNHITYAPLRVSITAG